MQVISKFYFMFLYLFKSIALDYFQVSKALLGEYMAAQKNKRPFKGLWLEHMNNSSPVIPFQLTSSNLRCSQFQVLDSVPLNLNNLFWKMCLCMSWLFTRLMCSV